MENLLPSARAMISAVYKLVFVLSPSRNRKQRPSYDVVDKVFEYFLKPAAHAYVLRDVYVCIRIRKILELLATT